MRPDHTRTFRVMPEKVKAFGEMLRQLFPMRVWGASAACSDPISSLLTSAKGHAMLRRLPVVDGVGVSQASGESSNRKPLSHQLEIPSSD
jgi:hypothetical protein